MNKKLYHVSHVGGLSVLEPRVSTHGKSYVYATEDLTVALLFGTNKGMGDLDGKYGGGCFGVKPYFYEGYIGAFKRRYENCSCYIYEVDPTNFQTGKTSYGAEVVSEKPVKILKCFKVENLYQTLLNLAKENKLDLKFYDEKDIEYIKELKNHIKERMKLFNVIEDKKSNSYKFCELYHYEILKELERENNLKF